MEGLIVLLVLAVLAVPVLLVVALVSISTLRRRVSDLELRVSTLQAAPPSNASTRASQADAAPMPPRAVVDVAPAPVSAPRYPPPAAVAEPAPVPSVAPPPVPPRPGVPAADAPPPSSWPVAAREEVSAPAVPGLLERGFDAVRRWFTEGNVPVKVGMLVLLAGVAALLKYAGDQGWLTVPLPLRYAGIAAAAIAGLVFGWRQRTLRPGFALALQGGAIGVLLLVVFAAFKISGLLQAPVAFGLTIVLVAGLCVLAVKQDSRTLAVLGILAGFLAPIWLSTGSGNHVALFSYYAVLNAGVFAIAWVRPWRVLNLLGFVFTFGIGTLWGVLQYRPAQFASTEPFLLLFFVLYLLIPVLHARRGDATVDRRVDGSLLFGTPLVAFSLQAALLEGERMPLALCALGLAAIYTALAAWLVRDARSRTLGQGHALLAVAFATLAVPLALSARATASVFALEGAGLVWLGLRQQRVLPRVSGVLLQIAAAVGFAFGVDAWSSDAHAIANATFMSALLIALAGFASAWFFDAQQRRGQALGCYLWGLMWWTGAVTGEIARFVDVAYRADVLLACAALTALLAAAVQRRRLNAPAAWTATAALAIACPLASWQTAAHGHPFAGSGALAWLAFAVMGVPALAFLRSAPKLVGSLAQLVWLLLWPFVLSLSAGWLARRHGLAEGWWWALVLAPWLVLAALALWRWNWLRWPLGKQGDRIRGVLQMLVFGVLGVSWLSILASPADASPLPWLPLLNPAELVQVAVLLLAARWLSSGQASEILHERRVFVLAGSGLLLATGTTLHAVHQWGGLPWDDALLSSGLAQTSLTVVWSVLGVIGWVLGSRRGHRGLWLTGAALMALVLAKLVFVDRQHLGNLLGIGSFIAYGLLCTVVGYLAPAPPRVIDNEVAR